MKTNTPILDSLVDSPDGVRNMITKHIGGEPIEIYKEDPIWPIFWQKIKNYWVQSTENRSGMAYSLATVGSMLFDTPDNINFVGAWIGDNWVTWIRPEDLAKLLDSNDLLHYLLKEF